MRREVMLSAIALFALIIFMLLFAGFLIINSKERIFFSPVPSGCSESEIKNVWDSVFRENSTGIILFSNTSVSGKCEAYAAVKNLSDILYFLAGRDFSNSSVNITETFGFFGNFTSSKILEILANISQNSSLNWIKLSSLSAYSAYGADAVSREISISDIENASIEFNRTFKQENTSAWNSDSERYYFNSSFISGNILKNKQFSLFLYSKNGTLPCASNWTAYNTSCSSNERKTQYYFDSNSCPGEVRENITLICDHDGNGIIGNLTSLNSRTGLSLYVNSSLINLSKTYSGNHLVQFKSASEVIVEFSWNFSKFLDLNAILILRQGSSEPKGYVLAKGIDASKKFFVERVSGYSAVCILNSEIDSIGDMSSNCTRSNEIYLSCPDDDSGISCSLNTDYIIVNGLSHSAAREFQPRVISTSSCMPSWNCTSFGSCVNNSQTRTCTDRNNCNTTYLRPNLNQSCVSAVPCAPNWTCLNWTPSECPETKIQTRTCTDRNNCGTLNGKPATSQPCEYEPGNTAIIIILIILIIMIILVIGLIIYFWRQRKEVPAQSSVTYFPKT